MICTNCGNQNKRGAANCAFCGSPMLPTGASSSADAPVFGGSASYYQNPTPRNAEDHTPLSPWAYFGYQLLFSIPLVGFILLIVFSCGGTNNINLRNYARSFWCGLLVVLILVTLAFVLLLLFVGIPALS